MDDYRSYSIERINQISQSSLRVPCRGGPRSRPVTRVKIDQNQIEGEEGGEDFRVGLCGRGLRANQF